MSLSANLKIIDEVTNTLDKFISNWSLAKITSPSVFFKQIGSIINYSELVPIVDFYKYLGEAIAHPKETIQFMRDNSAMPDFRLESGFNEIVAKALQDNTNSSVNSPIIEKLQSIFSQVGARGDFISNVFGGYAFIQSQMKEGKTKADGNVMRYDPTGVSEDVRGGLKVKKDKRN